MLTNTIVCVKIGHRHPIVDESTNSQSQVTDRQNIEDINMKNTQNLKGK